MAMGLPCLCSDIPENRETGGDHVAYTRVGDVDALAAGLASLMDDVGRRQRLGAGARANVMRFSSARIAAQLLESIERVLGRKRDGHVVAV
jgi:glycosyltransferase involved in cell wall biosynthesis